MPPATASIRPSVASCRTRRQRPAPSAARVASSGSRAAPRASSRLATFNEAISNTTATIARMMASGVPNGRRTASKPCAPEIKRIVKSAGVVFGCPAEAGGGASAACACWKRVVSSASACAIFTPGASRPITPEKNPIPRLASSFRSVSGRKGSQMSGATPV